jgi:acyl-homoserine-lactone acylase
MKDRLCFRTILLILVIGSSSSTLLAADSQETARWGREAQNVTIVRDDWGVAHVHGKTDADAVFGIEYAQAEDDFNRIETNYINSIGRMAEAEGESSVYQDLRMKLFIDPVAMKAEYEASPAWLKTMMNAFADGLNYYLFKHPEVKPRVIRHFDPWMALTFTEGSIGGDYEYVNLAQLEAFYGHAATLGAARGGESTVQTAFVHESDPEEPSGSNGMAIAPSNTAGHHALLLINPHVFFFFRSELQMASDEGLNAYGAVTWGQIFVYQGFNERVGWMHTSSGVDAVDEYVETITKKDGRFYYKYGNEERPLITKQITVPYKTDHGTAEKKFTVYRTQHGPIVREQDGKWVSIQLMQRPVQALMQSFLRTKSTDYTSYRKTMDLQANSSNNTVFADADGDIAYFHGNFIPRRDTHFDFTKPVDGGDPATDWHGLLTVDETPHLLNPKSGWIYNSNNSPWTGSGSSSLRKQDYPAYVESGMENPRGTHAIRLLQDKKDFTLDSLERAAFDSYLPWFADTVPALVKAWEATPDSDPLKSKLTEQIKLLRRWDLRWGVNSVPTSLAVFWGEELQRHTADAAKKAGITFEEYVATRVPGPQLLESLSAASDRLAGDFGSWKTPWGEINRYQRLNDDIVPQFNDAKPSIPVGFVSSTWGSLASYGAHAYPGTKRWYGTRGNSFVAVVEFGDRVRARAINAGGESGDSASSHFNDQAERYSTGDLREVYFYPSDLKRHTQREYHPGS